MDDATFIKFVENNHTDLIVKQTVGFEDIDANKNAEKVLKLFHKHSNIPLCKTVMKAHCGICPELKQILVKTAGPHRPVPILPCYSRSAHGRPVKGTTALDIYSTYRKYGISGSDVPKVLGSPLLRLKGMVGLLTPGFREKSISSSEAADVLRSELSRQNKTEKNL